MNSKGNNQATKEESTPALVPKLRFPEFRGTEWVEKILGDVAPLQRGFDLPSALIRTGDIPIVYSNGIQKYHDAGMATAPGLVTGRSGTIGKLHFIEHGEYWPHNTSLWVTDFKGNVPRFVYYLYSSIGISRFSSGSGVPTLNRNDVHAFSGAIPNSSAEQQKIADCLSSLDDLIAAQAQKLDALKTHKKGLMQQLFPREGEPQPRLRFPEFQDAGEWEVKRLSGLIDLISGIHLSPGDYSNSGEVPYFTGPSDFTNDLQAVTKWAKRTANVSQIEDTLITVKGSGVGGIWYSMLPEVALGRQLMAIRSKNCSSSFIFQFLLTKRSRLEDLGSGNLIPGLSRADILELEAYFPCLAEQHRIASCLSSIDALITAEAQKHEALKTHKKGLMQQLFPSAEAATA
jgi:restriction endonuclease S subunit